MKTHLTKKDKAPSIKYEGAGTALEKEIEGLIDREKTKNRLVKKLLNQTTPSNLRSNI